MKQAYMKLTDQDVTTVSRMELESFEGIKRDLCYVAVDLVAPHLIQQYDIMVLDKHNIVTRECLVTLMGVHNIRVLLLNSIDSPKPSREYKLAILPQFPSCGINRNSLNLSKYLAETWSLIKFIPTDGKQESREKIVNEIVVEQVQNLITWFNEVCTRDVEPTGSDIKPLKVKLEERASMIGRAVIVFDIIMYQLGKKGIQHEGAITELLEKLCSACEYYFGQITTEIDSEEKIGLPLQFLLKTFQWRQSENPLQYRIPESSKDNYEDLFAIVITQMLEAERDVVVIDDSWIKLLINSERTESEKLVKCVIECQLELLKRIGCISCSEDDEIALFSDENCESVTKQLQEAASEAFKTLSRKKTSMTSTTYVGKLKDAYKKSASNKKREMVGDGEKQGEKKARN